MNRLPKISDERARGLGFRDRQHMSDVAWSNNERAAFGFAEGELKEQLTNLGARQNWEHSGVPGEIPDPEHRQNWEHHGTP